MAVLERLEPKNVFRFFEQMCAIPHGSGNTKAISDWCVAFGRDRGLEVHQDGHNNVILIKEATPGYEEAQPVILQGHLDMVCEKDPECAKDMETEGIAPVIDGDWIRAKGTTLGGDDAIAVAMALAILDDPELPHPRLEAVFTVDEEIGMLGAAALEVFCLKGRKMLNLDSEEEGIFTVSCAGGNRTQCTLPVERAAFSGEALTVTVEGLTGGHSGIEIHKGRGNSNCLMGRLLLEMSRATELRLVEVSGGRKDNAIPRQTVATVAVADRRKAQAAAEALAQDLGRELAETDPEFRLHFSAAPEGQRPMDEDSTRRCLCLLACAPNGVQAMSRQIPGLVETSLNLGILQTREGELTATFCLRSSVDSQKKMLTDNLACLTAQLGGRAEVFGDYAGWEYRRESPLRDLMAEVYKEQSGREPKIEAIHAGVECGLFAGKLPGLDCVSIGPDMEDVHTPRERLSISSTQRVWRFVTEVLRRSR